MAEFEATVGTAEFPEVCAECRAPKQRVKVGKGKAAKSFLICTACEEAPAQPDKKPRITRASAKAKGNRGENEVVKLLAKCGVDAQRTVASGAAGSRSCESAFDTDVVARFAGTRAKIESKRLHVVPGLKSFTGLLAGSDWLRVKEDHAKQGWWFLSDEQMSALLTLAARVGKDA